MNNERLTSEDIKVIKEWRRMGRIFFIFLLLFTVLINAGYLLINENIDSSFVILIDAGIFLACVFLLYFINRKYNRDLKIGMKIIKIEKVQDKIDYISHEPGSGMPMPNTLGMKSIPVFYLIINRYRQLVDEELYNSVAINDFVEMHYTIVSNILLQISYLEKNSGNFC